LKGAPERGRSAQLMNYGLEFVDHSVIYCSAKWRLGRNARRRALTLPDALPQLCYQ
jgi:hypothetical protein